MLSIKRIKKLKSAGSVVVCLGAGELPRAGKRNALTKLESVARRICLAATLAMVTPTKLCIHHVYMRSALLKMNKRPLAKILIPFAPSAISKD